MGSEFEILKSNRVHCDDLSGFAFDFDSMKLNQTQNYRNCIRLLGSVLTWPKFDVTPNAVLFKVFITQKFANGFL